MLHLHAIQAAPSRPTSDSKRCLPNTSTFVPNDRLQCLYFVLPITRCAFGAHLDVGLAERRTPCRFVENPTFPSFFLGEDGRLDKIEPLVSFLWSFGRERQMQSRRISANGVCQITKDLLGSLEQSVNVTILQALGATNTTFAERQEIDRVGATGSEDMYKSFNP